MTTHYPTAGFSTYEKRQAEKAKRCDFTCQSCGNEWDAPGHIWWVSKMYCSCGEVVEAR